MYYTLQRTSLSGEPVYALYIAGFNIGAGGKIQHLFINYYDEPCGECVVEEPIDLDWENISQEEIERNIQERLDRFVDDMARNCFDDGFQKTGYLFDWGLLEPAEPESEGPFVILTTSPNLEEDCKHLNCVEEIFYNRYSAEERIESIRAEWPADTQFIIVEYQE